MIEKQIERLLPAGWSVKADSANGREATFTASKDGIAVGARTNLMDAHFIADFLRRAIEAL